MIDNPKEALAEALFDLLVQRDEEGVTLGEMAEHLGLAATSVPAVIAYLRDTLSDREGKPYVYQDGRYYLTGSEGAPLIYTERRLRSMRTQGRRVTTGTVLPALARRPSDPELRFLAKSQKRMDEDLTEAIEVLQHKIATTA